MNKRGAKAKFETKKSVAAALREKMAGNDLSRYLSLQLVEMGYMEAVKVEKTGRGRPAIKYEVTGKGRGLVALSAKWK